MISDDLLRTQNTSLARSGKQYCKRHP